MNETTSKSLELHPPHPRHNLFPVPPLGTAREEPFQTDFCTDTMGQRWSRDGGDLCLPQNKLTGAIFSRSGSKREESGSKPVLKIAP